MAGIKDILKGAASIVTGGIPELGKSIIDTIKGQFPNKMNEKEEKELEIVVMQKMHEYEIGKLTEWNKTSKQFEDFTIEFEGTASDLKSIPIIGSILIFLRGAFRPLMAYVTMYVDIMVFSGRWNLTAAAGENSDQAWSLLWVINICVLVFYFGERAFKNAAPLIEKIIAKSIFSKDAKQ